MKNIILIACVLLMQRSYSGSSDFSKLLNHKSFDLKSSESETAEHIVKFYSLVKRGYITDLILDNLLNRVKKSQHFFLFYPWLLDIKKISETTTSTDFINLCNEFKKESQTNLILKKLKTNKIILCRQRFLEILGNNILKKNIVSDDEINFLEKNYTSFLFKNSRKHFESFLRKIKSQNDTHQKISLLAKNILIKHQSPIHSSLLAEIFIDAELSRHVQAVGLKDSRYHLVASREIGRSMKNIFSAIEDKKTEEHLSKMIQELKNIMQVTAHALPKNMAEMRLNDLAKSLERNNYKNLANSLLLENVKHSNIEIKEDAFFYFLFPLIKEGHFKKIISEVEKNYEKWSDITDTKIKFWYGFALHKSENNKKAQVVFEFLVDNNPLSFYGIWSRKMLAKIATTSPLVSRYQEFASNHSWNLKFDELEPDQVSSVYRIKTWAKLGHRKFLDLESSTLLDVILLKDNQKQSELLVIVANIISQHLNYLESFKFISKAVDKKKILMNRFVLETLYPSPFLKEVTQNVKKESIDPFILLSLIRQESVFNPKAKSSAGAMGLMQLMPQTAKRLKRYVQTKHLNQPNLNIELGAKYFSSLYKRYDQNLLFTLSAYNAGEARVKKWQEIYFTQDNFLLTAEAIPFLETRNYVKLISRNLFFYKLLYGSAKEDSEKLNTVYDVWIGFEN